MATMNVSLPDSMKHWVEQQAGTGRFSNSSDYVRDLIRRDQERAGKLREMQQLISEGIQCGISSRSMGEIFEAALVKAAK